MPRRESRRPVAGEDAGPESEAAELRGHLGPPEQPQPVGLLVASVEVPDPAEAGDPAGQQPAPSVLLGGHEDRPVVRFQIAPPWASSRDAARLSIVAGVVGPGHRAWLGPRLA